MKSNEELTEAICRMIRALGRRAAQDDPDTGNLLKMIRHELESVTADAVNGWREAGFSDAMIGRELGVTKQAVQKRWPREVVAA